MSTADEPKQTAELSDTTAMDAPDTVATSTPGAQLRQARERKGMSLEQVAKETMLTSRYLRLLEADDYDALPGATFARGYLRRYAPVVGLAANELVAEFDAIWLQRNKASSPLIDAQVHALQQEPVGSRRGNRRAGMFRRTALHLSLAKLLSLTSVALLLTLLYATLFWNNDSSSTPPLTDTPVDLSLEAEISESTPAAPDAPALPATAESSRASDGMGDAPATQAPVVAPESPSVESSPAPASPAVADPSAASTEPAPVTATPAPSAPANAAPASNAQPPATDATPAPPRIDSLSFTFTGKSWISVRDATGQELVYGLKNAGQSVTVTGQPPFAINIGSVRDTQMSRNGVPVNLKPYTRGEIASFRLGR